MSTKGVYCLTSPSGKRYVGIACGNGGINRRWNSYKWLVKSIQPQRHLYRALKRHGPTSFKYEVILETNDIEKARRVEMQLIALWHLQDPKKGYNITAGGQSGMAGRKHSLETLEKMAKARKERKPVSDETRAKMQKSAKQRVKDGRNAIIGHKQTEQSKQKLREIATGRKMSQESLQKRSRTCQLKGGRKLIKVVNRQTGVITQGYIAGLATELGFSESSMRTYGQTRLYRRL